MAHFPGGFDPNFRHTEMTAKARAEEHQRAVERGERNVRLGVHRRNPGFLSRILRRFFSRS